LSSDSREEILACLKIMMAMSAQIRKAKMNPLTKESNPVFSSYSPTLTAISLLMLFSSFWWLRIVSVLFLLK
jgi:hypothetical protein